MDKQNTIQKTQKRTVMPASFRRVGKLLNLASKIAPRSVAKILARLWFKPLMGKPEPHIKDWQAKAQQKVPLSFGSDLHIFTDNFNLDAPLVLCMHGWRGRGFQYRRFIQPLVNAGYRVATFDAPAHAGAEDQKKWTHFFEFSDAILEVESRAGPIDSIIAHSFGCPTSVFAISETFLPRKLAMIAPNFDLDFYYQSFTGQLGLSEKLKEYAYEEIIKLADKRVFKGAIQKIHIDNVNPVLNEADIKFWYDPEDTEISTKSIHVMAEKLGGKPIQQVPGPGHFEILKSPEVIESVIEFIGMDKAKEK